MATWYQTLLIVIGAAIVLGEWFGFGLAFDMAASRKLIARDTMRQRLEWAAVEIGGRFAVGGIVAASCGWAAYFVGALLSLLVDVGIEVEARRRLRHLHRVEAMWAEIAAATARHREPCGHPAADVVAGECVTCWIAEDTRREIGS